MWPTQINKRGKGQKKVKTHLLLYPDFGKMFPFLFSDVTSDLRYFDKVSSMLSPDETREGYTTSLCPALETKDQPVKGDTLSS